jgi:hypothetical protein
MEASHRPWTLRLVAMGQFPDVIYLTQWLRETVSGKPPTMEEMVALVQEKWPERRFRVAQDQKIGRLIVEG